MSQASEATQSIQRKTRLQDTVRKKKTKKKKHKQKHPSVAYLSSSLAFSLAPIPLNTLGQVLNQDLYAAPPSYHIPYLPPSGACSLGPSLTSTGDGKQWLSEMPLSRACLHWIVFVNLM